MATVHAAHETHVLKMLKAHGVDEKDARALASAGLSWFQILVLFGQFFSMYGPQLFTIASQVIAILKGAGNAASKLAALQALIQQYGPTLLAVIQAIAAMLGITLPAGL